MGRLAVERRTLVQVLAVAQVVHFFEHDRQATRKDVARDLVEVGGDLGVVGGHGAEGLRGKASASLGADLAELAHLVDDQLVVAGIRRRRHAGGVARRGTQEGGAPDVDHLDRLVQADELGADRRGERLDVDNHEVDQADPLLAELLELGGNVAPGEDSGVDSVVEGLDLSADERQLASQFGDRGHRHSLAGQEFARSVRGEDLDLEVEQVASEAGDPFPVRH